MFISVSEGRTVNTKFTIVPTIAETKARNIIIRRNVDPPSKICSESTDEIDSPRSNITKTTDSKATNADKTGHKSHFADFPMSCNLRKFRDKFGIKKTKDAIDPSVLQIFCATICAS